MLMLGRGPWSRVVTFIALSACLQTALADASTASATSPLYQGPYATVLGRFVKADSGDEMHNGYGGTAGLGYRKGPIDLELRGNFTEHRSGQAEGGSFNFLIFPLEQRLPGLYLITGIGDDYVKKYPGIGDITFNVTNLDGGAGYIFPLRFRRYQFGLRGEVLYEYGKRDKRQENQGDINQPVVSDIPVESTFHNIIFQAGLELPFGLLPEPPAETAPPPPEVIPVQPAPPPPPPPPPPCKTPGPGERVSLAGCGTGDVIVLRGVNFEFDKDKLTVNARTILDEVVGELNAFPSINIELSGHTDGRGTMPYNQKLSERRAASVKTYLVGKGIAEARMTTIGYGKSRPIADNATDEGRELNRRVELKITSADAPPSAPAVEPVGPPVTAEPVPAATAPAEPVPAATAPDAAPAP